MNKKRLVAILSLIMAAIMIITLLIGLIPTHSHAAKLTSDKLEDLKKQLQEMEEEKKKIKEEQKALRGQISDNMSEMEKLVAEKTAIDQEIGMMNQQILIISDQITVYGMLIADKQEELDAARARLEDLRIQNKARIRAMEEEGTMSYWSVLFKASSFADLLDRLNMIKEIAEADQRRLAQMDAAAKAVEEAQAALEGEKALLEVSKDELYAIQDELALKRLEADEVLSKLVAKGEEYQKLLDAAEESEDALLDEMHKVETAYDKEYDRLKEEERKRKEEEERRRQEEALKNQLAQGNTGNAGNSDTSTAVPSNATWLKPCSYVRVSSPYGWRIHPVYGDLRFHKGVDLSASSGTPIYATRAGTVTRATYDSSSGYYVSINHGDGFSSSYLHMTHFVVSANQKVKAGQLIGYVGSTGTSTGPHLHFSIYYNGTSQNPAAYINF